MATGRIKTVRSDKGFGFIAPDHGADDLFFHHSSVVDPAFDELREGQRVEFDAGSDPRNPSRQRAVRVQAVAQDPPGVPTVPPGGREDPL